MLGLAILSGHLLRTNFISFPFETSAPLRVTHWRVLKIPISWTDFRDPRVLRSGFLGDASLALRML